MLAILADRRLERDRAARRLEHPLDALDRLATSAIAISSAVWLALDHLGQPLGGAPTWPTDSLICTGSRIVRPCSAIARVTAWRIHQVAQVEKRLPLW